MNKIEFIFMSSQFNLQKIFLFFNKEQFYQGLKSSTIQDFFQLCFQILPMQQIWATPTLGLWMVDHHEQYMNVQGVFES